MRLQPVLPLLFVADVHQSGQAAGVNQVIAAAQQTNDGPAPDFFHGVLLKEQAAPDAVLHVESAAGDGQVNVQMLFELAAAGMQGAKETNLHALFAGSAEHGSGGGMEQGIERRPVVVKKRAIADAVW